MVPIGTMITLLLFKITPGNVTTIIGAILLVSYPYMSAIFSFYFVKAYNEFIKRLFIKILLKPLGKHIPKVQRWVDKMEETETRVVSIGSTVSSAFV